MQIKIYFFSLLFITLALLLYGCSGSDLSENVTLQTQEELSSAEFNQANFIQETPTYQGDIQENEIGASSSEFQDSSQATLSSEVTGETGQNTTTGGDTEIEQIEEIEIPPVDPSKGFSAPEFSLSTITGSNLTLSELRGKNVVLNYWKSWCVPCMEELVALENLHRTYQDENLIILSVNGIEDDNLDDVNKIIQEKDLTYPVILDYGEVFWKSYKVLFLPTSFFIDEQGVIRDIAIGGDSEADFKLRIDQLITDQL